MLLSCGARAFQIRVVCCNYLRGIHEMLHPHQTYSPIPRKISSVQRSIVWTSEDLSSSWRKRCTSQVEVNITWSEWPEGLFCPGTVSCRDDDEPEGSPVGSSVDKMCIRVRSVHFWQSTPLLPTPRRNFIPTLPFRRFYLSSIVALV